MFDVFLLEGKACTVSVVENECRSSASQDPQVLRHLVLFPKLSHAVSCVFVCSDLIGSDVRKWKKKRRQCVAVARQLVLRLSASVSERRRRR